VTSVRTLWFVLVASILATPVAIAQSESDLAKQVRAWLEKAVAEAAELPELPGVSLHFVSEHVLIPPKDELAALEQRAVEEPGGRARALLETYRAAARGEFHTIEYGVWSMGEGSWRVNTTYPRKGTYQDYCLTSQHGWILSDETLQIWETSVTGGPMTGYGQFRGVLTELMDGGLFKASRLELESVTIDGTDWKAVFRADPAPEYEITYWGWWDASTDRGFMRRHEITGHPTPSQVGFARTYSDWRYDQVAQMWFASESEMLRPDGRSFMRDRFLGARDNEIAFDRLTAIPAIAGDDPLRGTTSFTRLYDYQSSEATLVDSSGATTKAIIPGSRSQSRLRLVGWAALALVAIALVALVLRRTLATGAS